MMEFCWGCNNFLNYVSAKRWWQTHASPGNQQAHSSMPPAPDNDEDIFAEQSDPEGKAEGGALGETLESSSHVSPSG